MVELAAASDLAEYVLTVDELHAPAPKVLEREEFPQRWVAAQQLECPS
jgi:hypothetical protein